MFILGSRLVALQECNPRVPALPSFPFFPPLSSPPFSFLPLFPHWMDSLLLLPSLSYCPFSSHFPSAPLLSLMIPPSAPPFTPLLSTALLAHFLQFRAHCPSQRPPPSLSWFPHLPVLPIASSPLRFLPPSFLCRKTQANQGGLSSAVAVRETQQTSDLS